MRPELSTWVADNQIEGEVLRATFGWGKYFGLSRTAMGEGDRPKAAIGHVTLRVQDVKGSCAFYVQLGLRLVVEKEELAILELRGGTHLLLFRAKGKPKRGPLRSFDIMVDDAGGYRAALAAREVPVSPLRYDSLSGHHMFEVTDPDGRVLTVLSDHTEGRPV